MSPATAGDQDEPAFDVSVNRFVGALQLTVGYTDRPQD